MSAAPGHAPVNAAQTGRLVYVVGPSGAGKDSVIDWLRQQLPQDARVHFARRTITRAVQPGGEQHDSLDTAAFMRLRDAGAFAMHWEANALHYGIARAELAARSDGRTVIVNGSRAYLPEAVRLFPELVAAHITADAQTLRRRLLARKRETPQMVDARVRRALDFQLPPGIAAIEVRNDAALADAGAQLQRALQAWRCL